MFWTTLDSPIGTLRLASDGQAITGLWMKTHRFFQRLPICRETPQLPVFLDAESWLAAYFSRDALPPLPSLKPDGSSFQLAVWQELQKLPYGSTTTYGAISQALQMHGIASSPQAVGGAVGRNPISILIPCHRVLGRNGALTGYAGGLAVKNQLLELEGIHI